MGSSGRSGWRKMSLDLDGLAREKRRKKLLSRSSEG